VPPVTVQVIVEQPADEPAAAVPAAQQSSSRTSVVLGQVSAP